MRVIGVTGSIGMGKSAAAARFRARGFPVFDADAAVHALYEGPLVADIEAEFPGVGDGRKVDRAKLSALLAADTAKFQRLEAIVHPRVRALERDFLRAAHRDGALAAVLEIPLLFESGGDRMCDAVIVVSANAEVQKQRVLERPGMTPGKFAHIASRQMPDAEKRRRADFIVETSGTVQACHDQIDQIIAKIGGVREAAFQRYWM